MNDLEKKERKLIYNTVEICKDEIEFILDNLDMKAFVAVSDRSICATKKELLAIVNAHFDTIAGKLAYDWNTRSIKELREEHQQLSEY